MPGGNVRRLMRRGADPDDTIGAAAAPYKGLMPYAEDDAPYFFGRDDWRGILIDNLRAYRLTTFYGESGVGKSSVLRAGVAHALREQARRNLDERGAPELAVVVFNAWQSDPVDGLVRALRDATARALGTDASDQGAPQDLEAALEVCAERVGGRLFLILDQFEEYFLYHAAGDGEVRFGDAFARAVNRRDLRATFLVSIREDALAKLDRFKNRIPNLLDNLLRIEHLDSDEAREAIVGPVDQWNERATPAEPVRIEPALVGQVLAEVEAGKVVVGEAGEGVVERTAADAGRGRIETPYLQLVMTRLWDEEMENGRDGEPAGERVLRAATLQRLGGSARIVKTHLDGAMKTLGPDERDLAAEAFRYLVTPSGTKIAHTVRDLADYANVEEARLGSVLETLSSGDVRILRPVAPPSDRPEAAGYEIFHDVLASAIVDWRARHLRAREQGERERERQAEAERQRKELEDARELARARSKATLVLLLLVAVLVLAAAGSGAITVWALRQRDVAREQRVEADQQRQAAERARVALSGELARSAFGQLETNAPVSMLLATRALGSARTGAALDALRASLLQPLRSVLPVDYDDNIGTYCPPPIFLASGGLVLARGVSCDPKLWRVADGKSVPLPDLVPTVANTSQPVSPDGRLVATVRGSTVVLRTVDGERTVAELRGHGGEVRSAVFSPDGKLLLTASADRTARVWATATGRLVGILKPFREPTAAAFSADARLVAIRSSRTEGDAEVWDLATTSRRGRFRSRTGLGFARAEFSPDGRILETRDRFGFADLWDLATGTRLAAPTSRSAPAFSRRGARFVVLGRERAEIWSTATRTRLAVLPAERGATAAAFSPSGRLLAVGRAGGRVALYLAATGKQLAVLGVASSRRKAADRRVTSLAFGPSEDLFVSGSADGDVRVWSAATRSERTTLVERGPPVTRVDLSPDGTIVAGQSTDDAVRLWELEPIRSLRAFTIRGGIAGASFAPQDRIVLVGKGGTAFRWDERGGGALRRLRGASGKSSGAAITPRGDVLFTVDEDGVARLVEIATGRQIAKLRGGVSSGAFDRSGELVATAGTDGAARLWATRDGDPAGVVRVARKPLAEVAIVPGGKSVVTARADGRVEVWDVATGRRLRTLVRGGAVVMGMSISPDGRLVALARTNGTTLVRSLTRVKRVLNLRGHRGRVTSAAFSADGKLLVTAGEDGTVRLWGVAAGRQLTRLRQAVPVASAQFDENGKRLLTVSLSAIEKQGQVATARVYACVPCGPLEDLLGLARARGAPRR